MSDEVLGVERRDHLAVLTMNRPDKLNAIDSTLKDALYAALDDLDAAFPDVRAIILTGTGRGFCSGADVGAMADAIGNASASRAFQRRIVHLGPRLQALPQPVIAAVNGVAAGAGLSLALASDVRLSSTEARYSCIFVKRALVPDTGACYTLPRTVGPGIAAEMALTGRVYSAEWALNVGLVNEILSPDELLPRALELAGEIAANPPITVRSIKAVMNQLGRDLSEVVAIETEINDSQADTEDRREALRSFVEKRAPVYWGR